MSIPLGAGRTFSDFLPDPMPTAEDIHRLRKHARAQIGRIAGDINRVGVPDQVVGSSKTFRSLARIAGAAPSGDGIYAPRKLFRRDLEGIIDTLASRTPEERATLPGVSEARAGQVLAGAIVAEAAFTIFDIGVMNISPWALREGIIMRKLDLLDSAEQSSAMRVETVSALD